MANLFTALSLHKAAKIAGVAFITMFIIGISSMLAALANLIGPGDSISIITTLIILACDMAVALSCYVFLKPVNKSLTLLATVLRLVYVALTLLFLFINVVSYGPLITYFLSLISLSLVI